MLRSLCNCGPKLCRADVVKAEKILGLRLPEAYVEFLLQHNGGVPSPGDFPITDMPQNPSGTIECFLSLGAVEEYRSLIGANADLRDRLPEGFVAVASTPSGSYLGIWCSGRQMGSVWLWDWYSKEAEPARRVYYVSRSFDELLMSIDVLPE